MQKIHIVFVMLLSGLSSLASGVGSLDTIIIDRGVDEPYGLRWCRLKQTQVFQVKRQWRT